MVHVFYFKNILFGILELLRKLYVTFLALLAVYFSIDTDFLYLNFFNQGIILFGPNQKIVP